MRLPEPGIGQSNLKIKLKIKLKKNSMKTPLQGSLHLVWAYPYKKKLHENATIGFPERRYRYGTQAP